MIEVRHAAHGVSVVRVTGNLVIGEGNREFGMKMAELIDAGRVRIVLDCANITRLDSSGLGEILRAYTAARLQRGDVKLLNPSPRLRHALELSRLVYVLEVHDNEGEARTSFER